MLYAATIPIPDAWHSFLFQTEEIRQIAGVEFTF
jgi:hypothetical protein